MGGIRLTSLFALTLAVSFVLGTAPREARAGVCKNLNEPKGCVGPIDVKPRAVKAKHRVDEAGMNFVSEPDTAMEVFPNSKIFTSVVIEAPAKGTVIVNASITVEALKNPSTASGLPAGKGTVQCALTERGSGIVSSNSATFFGSVDWEKGLVYETITITRGFSVSKKTSSKIALVCKGVSFNFALLRVRGPSISAAYYSN